MDDAENEASSSELLGPRERLARARTRNRDTQYVEQLRLWWENLSGAKLVLVDEERIDLALMKLLDLEPSLEPVGSESYGAALQFSYRSVRDAKSIINSVGDDVYLWLPVFPGIGVVDVGDTGVRNLLDLLFREDEEGDSWFVLAKTLEVGCLVDWSSESDGTRSVSVWVRLDDRRSARS